MPTSPNVIELDDDRFEAEVLRAEGPVLVDFGATWCGPCKALDPIVSAIADANVGRLKVVKMDTDESPRTVQRYGIRSAPTLLVFHGGERVAQHVGLTTKEKILALVASAAGATMAPCASSSSPTTRASTR